MNDDEKHLEEYKKHEQFLVEELNIGNISPEHKFWYENRLKSVRRLIQTLEPGEENG